jgi:uncharacterized protein YciI
MTRQPPEPELDAMPYIAICHDTTDRDTAHVRAAELQAHLDYIDSIRAKVLVAGPLTVGGARAFNASLFVYATDSMAEARQLLERDPYFQAGLYADVTLAAFKPARGTWL